eukprot:16444809-Heterocapsa_arctica.AAC.1
MSRRKGQTRHEEQVTELQLILSTVAIAVLIHQLVLPVVQRVFALLNFSRRAPPHHHIHTRPKPPTSSSIIFVTGPSSNSNSFFSSSRLFYGPRP